MPWVQISQSKICICKHNFFFFFTSLITVLSSSATKQQNNWMLLIQAMPGFSPALQSRLSHFGGLLSLLRGSIYYLGSGGPSVGPAHTSIYLGDVCIPVGLCLAVTEVVKSWWCTFPHPKSSPPIALGSWLHSFGHLGKAGVQLVGTNTYVLVEILKYFPNNWQRAMASSPPRPSLATMVPPPGPSILKIPETSMVKGEHYIFKHSPATLTAIRVIAC